MFTSTGGKLLSITSTSNPISTGSSILNVIIFSEPGEHKIWLEVNNGLETYDIEKTIIVEENLNPDFDWIVNFDDDDYQVPVKLTMQNNSISATSYQWTFENGLPATSTEENPEVIFNVIGNHQITLNVSNGKDSKFISKNIDVLTNTNLKTFENVKLGINSSHNNNVIGSFFSTFTRKSYTQNEVNNDNGALIDLVYFGLNESFTLNKFVSPNDLNTTTFSTIPNATHTKFINSLELCNCSTSLTVSGFDTMVDDSLLKDFVIEETTGGLQQFDNNVLPRIILFENSAGRKGAIKIKEYVQNGQDSYMLIDIKIQKQ